jgi:hypothetical protein
MGKRCLLAWWPEREGELSPIIEPSERNPIPDEVVVKTPDGRIVFRYNIVQAMNAQYFEAHA